MTDDLDDLPFYRDDDWPPAPVLEVEPKPCRHPKWARTTETLTIAVIDGDGRPLPSPTRVVCRCGVVMDPERARRGRSSRRLGHDGERRSEKRYGWRKVGEFGGITDLEGTLAIVQQKTSRRPAPPKWTGIFRELDTRAGGRIPLVLLSFVRQGIDTEDFIVIRGVDWLALHGRDEPGGMS